MILRKFRLAVISILLLGFSGVSSALTIPNPDPLLWGDDINGSGLYTPTDLLFSIEIFDPAVAPLGGAEFGFFYGSDTATLIPIFDLDDQGVGAGPAGQQTAAVSFSSGVVVDLDDSIVQNSFTPLGTDIGFYLLLRDPVLAAVFGSDPIFTLALLNPGGEDMAAEFPLLSQLDQFLINFAALDPAGAQSGLGAYLVNPLVPAELSEVPVPAAVWLFGTAMIGLFGIKRRRKLQV